MLRDTTSRIHAYGAGRYFPGAGAYRQIGSGSRISFWGIHILYFLFFFIYFAQFPSHPTSLPQIPLNTAFGSIFNACLHNTKVNCAIIWHNFHPYLTFYLSRCFPHYLLLKFDLSHIYKTSVLFLIM